MQWSKIGGACRWTVIYLQYKSHTHSYPAISFGSFSVTWLGKGRLEPPTFQLVALSLPPEAHTLYSTEVQNLFNCPTVKPHSDHLSRYKWSTCWNAALLMYTVNCISLYILLYISVYLTVCLWTGRWISTVWWRRAPWRRTSLSGRRRRWCWTTLLFRGWTPQGKLSSTLVLLPPGKKDNPAPPFVFTCPSTPGPCARLHHVTKTSGWYTLMWTPDHLPIDDDPCDWWWSERLLLLID